MVKKPSQEALPLEMINGTNAKAFDLPMNPEAMFDNLVENAFDFLNQAIQEFPSHPKYSMIHFCAAVELLIKARLMQEHWALIVAKPEDADQGKFLQGDFNSVGLDEANRRLSRVADDGIGQRALESFRSISKHRNRLIHFVHPDFTSDPYKLAQVVAEQSTAWFYLQKLLTEQWQVYFKSWRNQITAIDTALKKQRVYLRAKFEVLESQIEQETLVGETFVDCIGCGFRAARQKPILTDLYEEKCVVCDLVSTALVFVCPNCAESVVLHDDGHGDCSHCGHDFTPDGLVDVLVDSAALERAFRQGDVTSDLANCGECGEYHSVIPKEDKYLCTSCFGVFDRVEQCEWCSELNTGGMEFSYLRGCGHCEGKYGWEKDS